jgi:thiol-disulfide isomerase/thioredoxin
MEKMKLAFSNNRPIIGGAVTSPIRTGWSAFLTGVFKIEAVIHFTLYTRSYCHLCDDMLEALQALSSEYPFTVELIDVDADETLVAQFDELVPVLFGKKGNSDSVQLCNYFLDEAKTREFLAAA